MSVSKQSDVPQLQFFYPQNETIDLTQQARKALSLVWNDSHANAAANTIRPGQKDLDTAHCAVLGYN